MVIMLVRTSGCQIMRVHVSGPAGVTFCVGTNIKRYITLCCTSCIGVHLGQWRMKSLPVTGPESAAFSTPEAL